MNFLMSVLRPRSGSIAQFCTATLMLVILTGTSELLAQPRIIGVEPTSVELTAGGSPQTFRLTADGLTDVTGVRILQGRLTVTGFETTVRRTSITRTGIRSTLPIRTQAVGSVTFELELSAAASVAPGSYSVQVLTGRIAVTVPLDLRVVAAPRPARRAVVGGARTILGDAPTAVRIDSVEEPVFRRYWVTNIRPGASGRLDNQGIFDPAITDDPSDGVFWIEGANLDTPDLSIRMSGGYGSREAAILERSRSASMDVIKARVSDFPSGRLMVSTNGGTAQSSYVPRLGYWAFPVADVSALIQDVRCTIGSPRGRGTIVLPSRTLNFELGPMEGFGFRIETLDLNSNAITITSEPGGGTGREVVLTTRIDFETSGREFDGSFLPTITWWECGTLRVQASECPGLDLACFAREIGSALAASLTCMDAGNWRERTGPGPAVPISGDLTSPSAVFRTTLGIESGELVARAVDASFDANISLQTNVGTLPLGPLKSLILSGTDENLTEMIREANFGSEIATFVNNLSRGFGVERLRYIQRMSDGRIYMEYGQ